MRLGGAATALEKRGGGACDPARTGCVSLRDAFSARQSPYECCILESNPLGPIGGARHQPPWLFSMSHSRRVKGMVTLGTETFRIERLASRHYAVIRVSDDLRLGTFRTGGGLHVRAENFDALELEKIAREAIHAGRTSWVYNSSPAPPPVAAREPQPAASEEAPLTPRGRLAPA